MGRSTLLAAGLVLLVLTLAGCGAQASGGAPAPRSAPPASAAAQAAPGRQAPNFSIKTLDGKTFELSKEQGRVVALYFMAGWCGSCIPESKAWSELYPRYHKKGLDLLIISVDPRDDAKTIAAFRRAGNIRPLPWAVDRSGKVAHRLGVSSLDTTIIIDRKGKIVYRDAAPTPKSKLEQVLEKEGL
ncbi:peroxiredoxin family protein [Rubrobacter calidifluminis]|uniref:peroxiredoxin family protein n=1 Tax=Rubrobacter calidifluminis TaxID=1392640 RepID=UPI002362D799|nr:TlpA disulfide reductase family protein [Rubrobacter calidifluminis]